MSHPVLDVHGLERVSKTQVVTHAQYERDEDALAKALLRCAASVNKKVAGRDRAATYYYVTYEVVLDDDGGPGRPMRPSASGQAADVVFAGMSDRSSEREAA